MTVSTEDATFEGMEAEQKRKKQTRFLGFMWPSQKKPSPGRMAQTPRAGMGDSVGRFCRYHWSTLINYNSILSMCGTSLKFLLPPPDIRGLTCQPEKRPTIWIWVQVLGNLVISNPKIDFLNQRIVQSWVAAIPFYLSEIQQIRETQIPRYRLKSNQKFRSEFVLRNANESEYPGLVDFWG